MFDDRSKKYIGHLEHDPKVDVGFTGCAKPINKWIQYEHENKGQSRRAAAAADALLVCFSHIRMSRTTYLQIRLRQIITMTVPCLSPAIILSAFSSETPISFCLRITNSQKTTHQNLSDFPNLIIIWQHQHDLAILHIMSFQN